MNHHILEPEEPLQTGDEWAHLGEDDWATIAPSFVGVRVDTNRGMRYRRAVRSVVTEDSIRWMQQEHEQEVENLRKVTAVHVEWAAALTAAGWDWNLQPAEAFIAGLKAQVEDQRNGLTSFTVVNRELTSEISQLQRERNAAMDMRDSWARRAEGAEHELKESRERLETTEAARDIYWLERDQWKARYEDAFDCHGGPGMDKPMCGACITCLTRDSIQ